ncbi:helix-turn-helix domain-containing protein [Paenibacillus hexagrammi]|uniref:Helix-turn-helix domain-containing protein n=1 Tax=Paenibacillus hexagrammi TaxID=2908839 RepID=A0ABY3SKD3_9BACL|nr:helix-turn-helix domain-containing protein [Paenibacillus sp. YPD9-1]UJF34293.1 helix-turn-helix domain-containing protein [Paenibacillus sp. YPD9-1]
MMRKKTWLRFFYSYLFVFLVIILMLFFIFLYSIGNSAKREAESANYIYAQNVLKTFDNYLSNIQQTVILQILTNTKMQEFFTSNSDSPLVNYELYSKLKDIVSSNHGIDSIYVYRTSDQKVLTDSFTVYLEDFEDKQFIKKHVGGLQQWQWSTPRTYTFSKGSSEQQVVSMVHHVSLGTSSQGIVVVNLLAYSLVDTLTELTDSEVHYAFFTDRDNRPILTHLITADSLIKDTRFHYKSEITGWTLNTGLKNRTIGHFLSLLSFSWLLFAGIVVLIGIGMLFYVFRRNYKPIDMISDRIQTFIKKNSSNLELDPFAFIETSIEKLIAQSQQYEKQAAEDQLLRRTYILRELILGNHHADQSAWHQELQVLDIEDDKYSYVVLLVEIDEYGHFEQTYSSRDQALLKFAIRSVIQEISDQYTVSLWNNWMQIHRICHLIQIEQNKDLTSSIIQMCNEWRTWVEDQIRCTITIGIGITVNELTSIPYSYETASDMLEMKVTFGHNRIITHEMVSRNRDILKFDSLETIRSMTRQFITQKSNWEQTFLTVFKQMHANHLSRSAIASLCDYMLYQLNSELKELPKELQIIWNSEFLPLLNNISKQFDTIEKLEHSYFAALSSMSTYIQQKRENNSHYRDMDAIKTYIEQHYSDSNLSLNQISEQFQLSPPYFSTLFKEINGEKFIDYLTRIRMDHAKLLLRSSETSIQDIAISVGYVHSFSFIRVFKKLEGMTPGEYRKNHQTQKEDN